MTTQQTVEPTRATTRPLPLDERIGAKVLPDDEAARVLRAIELRTWHGYVHAEGGIAKALFALATTVGDPASDSAELTECETRLRGAAIASQYEGWQYAGEAMVRTGTADRC